MRKLNCFFLLLLVPMLVLGQEVAKPGTAGAQFLKIGLSARAAAMAEAYTVAVDNSEAVFWNPGALAVVQSTDLNAAYVRWPADITYSGAAAATYLEGFGTIGVHVATLMTGDMRVRSIYRPEGTGEMFRASQFVTGVTYATFLTDKFAVGGTIKYVQEDIWNWTAKNFGVDVGTYYKTGYRNLVIGVSIMNFGPEMAFNGSYTDYSDPGEAGAGFETKNFADYPMPLTFRFGLAMTVYETDDVKVFAALDSNKPNDAKQHYNAGAEFMFMDMLALRGGYKLNYDEDSFTFGAGINTALFGDFKVRLDYAYSDMGVLDVVHRGSIGFSF